MRASYFGMLGRAGESLASASIPSPCLSQRPHLWKRSKVPMVNEQEDHSANEQEIQDILFEEIWNRPSTLYTSFRKYSPYLNKRRPCGPISFDA